MAALKASRSVVTDDAMARYFGGTGGAAGIIVVLDEGVASGEGLAHAARATITMARSATLRPLRCMSGE